MVGVTGEAGAVGAVPAHAQSRANEEQVVPATSFSTGLLTVRHAVAGAPLERDRDAVVLGAEPAEKRTRCPRCGVRSESRRVIAGRTITSTVLLSALPERAR